MMMNNLDRATIKLDNIFQEHLQIIAPTRSLLDWNQKKLHRVSVESKVSNHLFLWTGWVCQNHVISSPVE